MNGYVIAGYTVVFFVLAVYTALVVLKERSLLRRRSARGRR